MYLSHIWGHPDITTMFDYVLKNNFYPSHKQICITVNISLPGIPDVEAILS